MEIILRSAFPHETNALSALCLRSKGHWGYDAAFLDACKTELTIRSLAHLIVAEARGRLAGVAQIAPQDASADLHLLFVDPPFIGQGIGRCLFDWCLSEARATGARSLTIEADPGARGFYEAMGARVIGTAPSGAVPGRVLPLLAFALQAGPRNLLRES